MVKNESWVIGNRRDKSFFVHGSFAHGKHGEEQILKFFRAVRAIRVQREALRQIPEPESFCASKVYN